jgi:hypothetical protein
VPGAETAEPVVLLDQLLDGEIGVMEDRVPELARLDAA